MSPTKITITSIADTSKKYTISFQSQDIKERTDIVFRGKDLWENNPKAANLEYSYKDLAGEVLPKLQREQAERERIAKEKQEEERQKEEWAKRVESINNLLILKSPKGDIRFEVGKPFPYDKVVGEKFIIRGKTVSFEYYHRKKCWELIVDRERRVVDFYGKEKGKIIKISHYSFYSYEARTERKAITKGYLGYGIFDVK
ncbi:MAG: hypothetical protein FWF51_03540 [Chitinivibrionia bacterium]|nr:hypothetical protein [Chitinivibrionia bacterium]